MIKHSQLLHSGSVPCGASTSTQPDHVEIEMNGGASTSTQPDHVEIEMDGGASISRQQDDEVGESDAGAFTSRQQDEMVAEASTSRPHNDEGGEIEEETPPNADQGGEKSETEEDRRKRNAWVRSIEQKLQAYTGSEAARTEISIPRVPKGPRGFGQAVKKPYEPSVISIGPLHRDKPHLQNMQKRKWELLKAMKASREDLNYYYKKLKEQENRARSFYHESAQQPKSGHFLEMLLLDGCFIVNYLYGASSDESKSKMWSDPQIRNDLLLLENQLPFFVVEHIYGLVNPRDAKQTLIDIAVKFFHTISPKKEKASLTVHEPGKRNLKHLLHLYHAYLFFDEHIGWRKRGAIRGCQHGATEEGGRGKRTILPLLCPLMRRTILPLLCPLMRQSLIGSNRKSGSFQVRTIPRAILLEEAGVKFKKRETFQVRTIPRAIFLEKAGVKFKKREKIDKVISVKFKDGVMHITPLVIDASTISRFLNLIEFERAHPEMEPRVTGFLQFMDYIINTSEDVALLRKNGILEHSFGSDEEVADIFNRLTSGTFHQLPLELEDVYEGVDSHYKDKWNHWWAALWRDHFGSPWAVIALLIAFLLVFFDATQTVFSVLSYVRPRSAS